MFKYAAATLIYLAAAQPASAAEIFDYNVYASGAVSISGGSYGNIASGSFANANGRGGGNFTSNVASTASLNSSASDISAQLLALTPTGSFSYGRWNGDVRLTGTSSGVNVFNIGVSGAPTWSQLGDLTFTGPGTGAIVNVWGTSLSNHVNLDFGSLSPDQVIFNFHQASNVGMGGMNVGGTILAPNATVSINGGSVAGSVIARDLYSQGANIGGEGFTATLPDHAPAVPEPGTWLMMILGFGAIGAMMRYRRAASARAQAA